MSGWTTSPLEITTGDVQGNVITLALEDLTAGPSATVSNPKFQLFQDKAGQFRFRLRAHNGKIIAASEGYTTKASALGGIESVRLHAQEAEIQDR